MSIQFVSAVLNVDDSTAASPWGSEMRGSCFRRPTPTPQKRASFTGSPYLYADHVEDYWEKLENRARICRPIETFDYGMREFAAYEDNDDVIQLSQNSTGR